MILDRTLARRMAWLWRRRLDDEQGRRFTRHWASPRWSPYRYDVYLQFLTMVAGKMSCDGHTWSPDLVELILFRNGPEEVD